MKLVNIGIFLVLTFGVGCSEQRCDEVKFNLKPNHVFLDLDRSGTQVYILTEDTTTRFIHYEQLHSFYANDGKIVIVPR